MRSRICVALAALCLAAPSAFADGWEIEATGGMFGTSSLTGPAPFSYRGLSFGGPYTTCPLEVRGHPRGAEFGCFAALGLGAGNIGFGLQGSYGPTWAIRLQARRRLDSDFALATGILAGLARRRQRVVTSGELLLGGLLPLDLSAPVLPDDLEATLGDPGFTQYDSTGTDALAYLHAGLYYERRLFGSGSQLGANGLAAFAEAGGGWLPEFPGNADAGLGTRAGVHAGLGVRYRRAFGSDVTLSLLHVHSLGDTPEDLTRPEFRWTGFQLGIVLER